MSNLTRHQAREITVQFLYQIDINKNSFENNLDNLREEHPKLNLEDGFLNDILIGTYQNIKEIDEIINKYTIDWNVSRMSKVDRNIIRLIIYEILYQADIPLAVSINEGVELAKSFSDEQSAKFINGVLAKVVDGLGLT